MAVRPNFPTGIAVPPVATPQGVSDGSLLQAVRGANVFKTTTIPAATGSVALWTPTAGKKFRVLKWWIEVSGNAAQTTAGPLTVSLLDAAAQVGLARTVSMPSSAGTAATGNLSTQSYDIGPLGYLSTAANNVLNATVGANLTAGLIRVSVAGVEE